MRSLNLNLLNSLGHFQNLAETSTRTTYDSLHRLRLTRNTSSNSVTIRRSAQKQRKQAGHDITRPPLETSRFRNVISTNHEVEHS
jgi:hypothetical protein